MLSDQDIADAIYNGSLGLDPFDHEALQPASVDMRLSNFYRKPYESATGGFAFIDVAEVRPNHTILCNAEENGGCITMYPRDFIIGATVEKVSIPDNMMARVEGKSSLGRIGLAVHITAGFIDPGFQGSITLEIANLAPWPIQLRSNMKIAQIAFSYLSSPCVKPYGIKGHYQAQSMPTESRYRTD